MSILAIKMLVIMTAACVLMVNCVLEFGIEVAKVIAQDEVVIVSNIGAVFF